MARSKMREASDVARLGVLMAEDAKKRCACGARAAMVMDVDVEWLEDVVTPKGTIPKGMRQADRIALCRPCAMKSGQQAVDIFGGK